MTDIYLCQNLVRPPGGPAAARAVLNQHHEMSVIRGAVAALG